MKHMKQVEFALGKVSKPYPHRYYSEGPNYRFKEPYYLFLNDNDNIYGFFIWLRDNYPYEFYMYTGGFKLTNHSRTIAIPVRGIHGAL